MSDLNNQVKEKATLAVSQFQTRVEGKLDYSPESLVGVESFLDDASDFIDDMPISKVDAICELMGSYILYVGYTQYGGNFYWSDDHNQPVLVVGEPNYRVAMMAFDKVRGRLSGDDADNIPFFYKGFSEQAKIGKSGTDVLYV